MPSTIAAISSPPRVDPPLSSSGKSHASAGSVSDTSWSLTQWPSAAPAAAFLEDGTTDDAWINVALAAHDDNECNSSSGDGDGAGVEEDCLGDDQGQKFQEEAHWMSFQRAIQSFAAQRQEAVVTRHTTTDSNSNRSSGKKQNSTGANSSHCSLVGNRPPFQHATKRNNSDEVCVTSVIQDTASISIHDSSSTTNRQESKDQKLN